MFYESNRAISTLMIPFIEVKEEWMLNNLQSSYLKALSIFDICSKLDKNILGSMKRLTSSSSRKYCDIFICYRENKSGYSYEMLWTEAILKSVSYDSSKIGHISHYEEILDDITKGATFYIRDAVHISDIQSRPRILSTDESLLSSSVFINQGSDAIINIGWFKAIIDYKYNSLSEHFVFSLDISSKYTLLSYSTINSKGFVESTLENFSIISNN